MKIEKSKGKGVKGKSFGVFGIGANIKDAMDKALQSAGPDYDMLVDGVVRMHNYPFWAGYSVTGTAIRSNEVKASLGEEGFKVWSSNQNILDPEKAEVIIENN